jgi:DNA-directed RNA polymerase subunit F
MMDVIEDKSITLPEVADILKAKEKEYGERGVEMLYGQRRALDHTSKFTKVNSSDAGEMTAKLSELDLALSAERIVKIIDLMPKTVDDIRAIFAKERFKYTEDEIKKIIDVVDQYR